MTDYAGTTGAMKQVLMEDNAINLAVDGQIYVARPGVHPSDSYLTSKDNQACIGIHSRAITPIGMGGVAYHGLSDVRHLVDFIITVNNIADRDSYSYASALADLVQDLLQKDISIALDKNYDIHFKGNSIKIIPFIDPNFESRANVKVTAEAFYID